MKNLNLRLSIPICLPLLLAQFPFFFSPALADTFILQDGRVISGIVKNAKNVQIDNATKVLWTVEIEPGVYARILDSELIRNGHKEDTDRDREYERRLSAISDTADEHYTLAGWCGSAMEERRMAHLLRAIDLDPNHRPARIAAGFKEDTNGRWVKIEEIMQGDRGKIFYKGRWRYPESVAIEEAEEQANDASAAASVDIARWHRDVVLGSDARRAKALEELRGINQPGAINILSQLLLDTYKPALQKPTPAPLKLLYMKLLTQFDSPNVARTLAQSYMASDDSQLQTLAINTLQQSGRETAISVFLGYLGNSYNPSINRAAEGLGQLAATDAVLPLIYALNTEHTQTVGGGNTNYSTQGMSFGNKQKEVKVQLQNASVLATLGQMTGQGNFGYDEPRWLAWYASRFAPPADDLRRDY